MVINWLINKKNSIFFQINLLFLIIFIIINLLIIVQFLFDNKTKQIIEEARYFNAFKIIIDSKMMNKSDDEITLFKTVGSGVLDVMTGKRIYEKAVVEKRGQLV